MLFSDYLKTCTKKDGTPLSARTIEHYASGLKTVSEDMLHEKVIEKPLQDMELFELDLAIALIYSDSFFQKKDRIGNKMYSNSLKRFRHFVSLNINRNYAEAVEVNKIKSDLSIAKTEREAIIKARVGQGLYRRLLLEKYVDGCIITHVKIPEILIASHIKPWSVSDNVERISESNGFILSATYDRLFDQGLISFQNDGKILISSMISNDNATCLRLERGKTYDIKYNPKMNEFLEYHRDLIFIR